MTSAWERPRKAVDRADEIILKEGDQQRTMPPNPTGPTSVQTRMLVRFLRKAAKDNNSPIWRYVADLISKPRRKRVEVNLYRIDRVASEGDTILVPGKLLGVGRMNKRVTVAAWKYSKSALEALERSGCEAITIPDLVRRNPKGSNVKIVI